jgi:hypothetical protein
MLLILYCLRWLEGFFLRLIGIQGSITISKFVLFSTFISFSFRRTRILVSTPGEKIKESAKGRRYYKTIPPPPSAGFTTFCAIFQQSLPKVGIRMNAYARAPFSSHGQNNLNIKVR